jgi:hypothetical protein
VKAESFATGLFTQPFVEVISFLFLFISFSWQTELWYLIET